MFSLKYFIALWIPSMGLLPVTAAVPTLDPYTAQPGSGFADIPATPRTVVVAPATQPSEQVTIDNFSFQPATLTVPVGTKVTWTNRDDSPHTVTGTGRAFSSKALDTDDQFSHVFTKAGTYTYFCAIHPHMKATVIVK